MKSPLARFVLLPALSAIAGGSLLVVEIAAARALAPVMGVSLYSWTAIIGLVLTGLAIGSWIGGAYSDRHAPQTLSLALALGAGGAILAPMLIDLAPGITLVPRTDVIGRTLLISAIVLMVPALALGAVVPALAALTVDDGRASGRSVGLIYASATAGNIAGVFATGFYLVEALGSRGAIVAAGGILAAGVVIVAVLERSARRLALATLVGIAVVTGVGAPSFRGPCTWESAYFCLQFIEEELIGGRTARSVRLDRLVHGSIYVEDPTYLDPGYLRVMADLTATLTEPGTPLRTLQIGGGSYTLARYLEASYPDGVIDVIEIDPMVTRFASAYLGLRPKTRVRSFNVDGRQFFLDGVGLPQYDLIYGDAFNDLSIPYHLTTREFVQTVSDALAEDGIYLANVIDLYWSGRFLRSFVATVQTVFPHVAVAMDRGAWDYIRPDQAPLEAEDDRRRTYVVVASHRPLDFARLSRLNNDLNRVVPAEILAAYVADTRTVILTDDRAPVDLLVSPLFRARPF